MSTLLFTTSAIFGVAAYVFYFKDTRSSLIVPNRWSWLAFGISSAVEALTFNEVTLDPLKSALFFVSSGCCIVVTVLIWSTAKWKKPDWTELFCLASSVVATVLWLYYGEAWWAHVVMIIAIPVAFIPTYRGASLDWRQENTPAWMLWTLGDALALGLVVMRLETLQELPYAMTECVCHAVVWWMVARKRKAPSR